MMMAVQPVHSENVTFQVDREHGSLRLVTLLIFLGSWTVVSLLLLAIISSDGINLLAIIGGFLAAYLIAGLAERWLKKNWRSGKTLVVDGDGLRILKGETVLNAIRADESVTVLCWRFQVKKRARIPKGWWMFAVGLESDSALIAAYTFLPPSEVETYIASHAFKILEGKASAKKGASESASLRLAGEERRLRAAEELRWMSGVEMTGDEFKQLVERVKTQFPEWDPVA